MKQLIPLIVLLLLAALLSGCGTAAPAGSVPETEVPASFGVSAAAQSPAADSEAPTAQEPAPDQAPEPEQEEVSVQESTPAPEPGASAEEPEPDAPSSEDVPEDVVQAEPEEVEEPVSEPSLHLTIGDTEVMVAWEDNESAEALKGLVSGQPLTVELSMYGGFEQVGSLGEGLPQDDVPTVTEAGDIVLYSGDQIVIFYGSNSWDYTRLGRITDRSEAEMAELLGNGDVTITLSWE